MYAAIRLGGSQRETRGAIPRADLLIWMKLWLLLLRFDG